MQGTVMDIKNGKAVVFRKNGDMTQVKDKGYQIGQTVNITAYSHKRIIAAAACFILVLVTGITGYTAAYRTPSGYIYVDINPSMRLNVNCFDKVISVLPLNTDAEELMKSYRLGASDAEQCIDEIVFACRESKYLNDNNNGIELSVVTKKTSLNNSVRTVSEKLRNDNLQVFVYNVDEEENSRAMKYSASPKRLAAVEAYTNTFGGTLEDNFAALKGITNREIYAEIEDAGNASEKNTRDGKYKSSPERLKAVKEYTRMFGGSLEENMKALKGIGTKEIYAALESQTPLAP